MLSPSENKVFTYLLTNWPARHDPIADWAVKCQHKHNALIITKYSPYLFHCLWAQQKLGSAAQSDQSLHFRSLGS